MLGYGFLRQKPIHKYITDFYCTKLKLVIEIDGDTHREKLCKDQKRQKDLEDLGLHVLRFNDREVKQDLSNVLGSIQCWIEQQGKTARQVRKNPEGHPLHPLQRGTDLSVMSPCPSSCLGSWWFRITQANGGER